MAVELTRRMASRGFRIRGSGTSSTRSCSFPYQTFAFMWVSASIAAGQAPAAHRAADEAAASGGLALRGGDLAAFQELFEPSQVFANLGLRVLAQQSGEGGSQLSADRAVVNAESDNGAPAVRRGVENNRARVGNLRSVERAPREGGTRPILGDFAIPLQRRCRGTLGHPVKASLIESL